MCAYGCTEKELREAAHAEVAKTAGLMTEMDKGSKKRKALDSDEKIKQRLVEFTQRQPVRL